MLDRAMGSQAPYIFDEIPELPSELIGQKLLYKVKIINIKNIPKNFSANLKVEYQSFYDHSISSTKIYNQKAFCKEMECFT